MLVLEIACGIAVGYVVLCAAYQVLLALVALCCCRKRDYPQEPRHRFALVVPAHNEESVIDLLLNSLNDVDYPAELYEVFVIADNCSDKTAEIARRLGCTCLERHDTENPGKGQALQWALPQVVTSAPDAIMVVDADCVLDPSIFRACDFQLSCGADVLQTSNLVSNPEDSYRSYAMAVARVLENSWFYWPKTKLGLPAFLIGSGMVIRTETLVRFPWREGSLNEDFEYCFRLINSGIVPRFVGDAGVMSPFPVSKGQMEVQRARWIAGGFQAGIGQVLPWLWKGLTRFNGHMFDSAFTLLVLSRPLIAVQVAFAGILLALTAWQSDNSGFVQVVSLGYLATLLAYAGYAALGVVSVGLNRRNLQHLLALPLFVADYLRIALRCLFRGGPRGWEKTPRGQAMPGQDSEALQMPVVLSLTASRFVGGPERQMLELAGECAVSGYAKFILASCYEEGLSAPFCELAAKRGIESLQLRHDTPHLLAAYRELVGLMKLHEIDLVITQSPKPDFLGWAAARRLRIPIISVSRGWTGETTKVRIYDRIDRLLLRRMDRVVCVSEGQAQKVKRLTGMKADRIAVIRNAIRPERFANDADPLYREQLENRFVTPPRILLGAAGRLSPEKGFDVLVDAVALCVRRGLPVGAVLFGEGALSKSLDARIRTACLQDRFVIAGFTDSLDAFMPHFDVFVQSSHTEGLPNVLLEASAAGVSVVATDVGGTAEVVADEQTGLLVPADNPGAMADAIARVVGDAALRSRLGAAGRQRVRSEFTFARQAAEYRRLFGSLLPRSQRSRLETPSAKQSSATS